MSNDRIKYSEEKINLIYKMLIKEKEAGNIKEYDIRVDGLKVISRTSNPDRFMTYKEYILPDTEAIRVNIYDGKSNRCSHYTYTLLDEISTQRNFEIVIENKNDRQIKCTTLDLSPAKKTFTFPITIEVLNSERAEKIAEHLTAIVKLLNAA
jgi:uncharacterized phage-like protein YoqJ